MASPELLALLDESFVLVDHLRFITRSRTAIDRRGVSRTAVQFKRELSEHKLAATGRARQGAAKISKAAGLTERLAERLTAHGEVEAHFVELLRLEGEATQVCMSAEAELEAACTDLAEEDRHLREAVAAARQRAERVIAQAAATHEAARCEAGRQRQSSEAELQQCVERVLGMPRSAHSWIAAGGSSGAAGGAPFRPLCFSR